MNNQENIQPKLRQRASDIMRRLSSSEREALLIKCWMSHDARWFMAVAMECGIEVANRLNQIAAHEIGKVEAKRIVHALQLPVKNMDDYLLAQEVLIGFFGPDLLDYRVIKVSDNTYQVHVKRCFANENIVRAGIAEHYECGIFARVTGWLKALGLEYEMTPSLGKCLKVEGRECIYTFSFKRY
jgi:predicted DNA-binding protein